MQFIILVFVSALAVGCSSASHKTEMLMSEPQTSKSTLIAGSSSDPMTNSAPRQIKKTAYISIEVDKLGESVGKVEKLVSSHQGQIESATVNQSESAHLLAKVPPDSLSQLIEQIVSLGIELEKTVSTEDLTQEITDASILLKTQRALHSRLTLLLKRAKDVKEILEIERELARIQADIEQLQGRLKRAQNDVAMSTLNINLRQKVRLGPFGWIGYQFGRGLKWLFIWE